MWRKDLYIEEAERQLNNTDFYVPITSKSTTTDNQTVKKVLFSFINSGKLPSDASNLVVKEPKEPCFYMLPKIHKINTPGRPIVSACSCPTELISEFVDSVLQPLVSSLPSFVKDTNDALRECDNFTFPQNTPHDERHLFTMDVTSLYTNIPHGEGLVALKHFLPKSKFRVDPVVILRLAELVLTLTSFKFGDQHYKQVRGVAMGTKMGPSFACLFMGYLEERIFQAYVGVVPLLYRRFIDDCFGAAAGPLQLLINFINFVSSFHPSIKFTHQVSATTLPFLDIQVSIHPDSDKLSTSVFYKPTDSHSYLNYTSCHPPSTKSSIPYSQFLRLRRLCSCDEDFDSKSQQMASFFTSQGYEEQCVQNGLCRAKRKSRAAALDNQAGRSVTKSERPVLSIIYHPHNLPVANIIKKNFHIIQSDPDLSEIFPEPPLVAFKRDTSLRDQLVHSKLLSSPSVTSPGTHPCGLPRCKICPHVSSATSIRGPKGSFEIKRHFTCQSADVVYAVICSLCSDSVLMMYVGETFRTLAARGEEHLRAARLGYNTQVGEHFQRPGHCADHFTICCVWQNSGESARRKFTEMHLAHRLGTFRPSGMNIRS